MKKKVFAAIVAGFSFVALSAEVQIQPTLTTEKIPLEEINYPTEMYTALGVENLIRRNNLGGHIACFIIPLNCDATGATFTDFELKGSTNNFWHAEETLDDEFHRLQFYSQSEKADSGITVADAVSVFGHANYSLDKMWVFVCTSKYERDGVRFNGDNRSYYWVTNTMMSAWNAPIVEAVVLVEAKCLLRHPETNGVASTEWLHELNPDLMWCYTRYTGNSTSSGREYEPGTSSVYWHPIMPVRWYREMPEWAKRQIVDSGE